MRRTLIALLCGWVVTTISGEMVAGPFLHLQDCQAVAELMAAQSPSISRICQARY